jgi:hypothetical protein
MGIMILCLRREGMDRGFVRGVRGEPIGRLGGVVLMRGGVGED